MLQASPVSTASAEVFLARAEPATGPEPASIRRAAADLVAVNRTGEAMALVLAGLSAHPESEDLWVMRALISEMRHDWADASHALEQLFRIQGSRVPAETWCHRVRVLRCLGHSEMAFELARQGLAVFAGHPMLMSEWQTLKSMHEASGHRAAA